MTLSRRTLFRRTAATVGGLLFADVLGVSSLRAADVTESNHDDDLDPNFINAQIQSVTGDVITARTPQLATRSVSCPAISFMLAGSSTRRVT